MVLKAVFLDVGNTLVHEEPTRFEIYAEGARRRGVVLETEAMHALMRLAHRELPREIGGAFRYTDRWFEAYIERIFHIGLGLPRAELAPLHEELFSRFADPATFALHPGAIELLERLRARGLKVGIVSNWSHRLPRLLEDLGVSRRVDFVLCSALERLEKPEPAIFERALARAGVAAEEALHAGDDYEKDFLGASRAGLRAVLVDHSRTARAEVTPRVHALVELDELVTRWQR